jgi:hypothetical protein
VQGAAASVLSLPRKWVARFSLLVVHLLTIGRTLICWDKQMVSRMSMLALVASLAVASASTVAPTFQPTALSKLTTQTGVDCYAPAGTTHIACAHTHTRRFPSLLPPGFPSPPHKLAFSRHTCTSEPPLPPLPNVFF